MGWLSLLYSLSFLIWFWVAHAPNDRVGIFIFLGLTQHFFWLSLFKIREKLSSRCLVISALLCFFCARLSPPLYENDFYRYFWDGQQTLSGKNPYSQPPLEVAIPHLEWLRSQVAFPEFRTIYPPLAQILFAVFAKVSFGQLSIFLWGLISFGAVFWSVGFYRKAIETNDREKAIALTALVSQHPLLVKEWYQSCHFDIWLSGLLVWVIVFKTPWKKAFIIGLGTGVKLVAAPLLMVFFPLPSKETKKVFVALMVSLLLASALIWNDFFSFFSAVKIFGEEWEMNSGPFRWVRELFSLMNISEKAASLASRGVVAALFLVFSIWITFFSRVKDVVEKMFWVAFLLVALSPVANPWYYTWSLPLVFFISPKRRDLALKLFCFLPLSYAFYFPQMNLIPLERWWDIEYLGMATTLWFSRKRVC